MKRIAYEFNSVGDKVEGVFDCFLKVKNGYYMQLDGVDNPISVSTALKRIITNNRAMFVAGAKIEITLKGFAAGRGGGQTKLFDVIINGDKCTDLVGTIANENDLDEFFS